MDITQRCLTISFLLSCSVFTQAQNSSLSVSIKDEMKKDLLKQIKPSSVSGSSMQQHKYSIGDLKEETLSEYIKRKVKSSAGEEFDDKYKVAESITNINPKVPLNKLPDGHVTPEFINGRWVFVNTAKTLDGLVKPSGIDLSGGGTKKMSEKTKNILKNVLGQEVDESPITPTKELLDRVLKRPDK